MKTYRGYSDGLRTERPCIVVVQEGKRWRPLVAAGAMRAGWSWGHGGAGARCLARDLLADHLGREPSPAVCERFVWEVVGRWAQGWRWTYTSRAIDHWLAAAQRRGIIPRDLGDGQPVLTEGS